jgi:hypothetical protein
MLLAEIAAILPRPAEPTARPWKNGDSLRNWPYFMGKTEKRGKTENGDSLRNWPYFMKLRLHFSQALPHPLFPCSSPDRHPVLE